MKEYQIRVIARAVKLRADSENKTVDEILEEYSNLTEEDKQQIRDYISNTIMRAESM